MQRLIASKNGKAFDPSSGLNCAKGSWIGTSVIASSFSDTQITLRARNAVSTHQPVSQSVSQSVKQPLSSPQRSTVSKKQRQPSPVATYCSLQVFPTILSSYSIAVLQRLLGLSLLHCSYEFQLNTSFSIAKQFFVTTLPIRSLIRTVSHFPS
jgi:hypothetical protein